MKNQETRSTWSEAVEDRGGECREKWRRSESAVSEIRVGVLSLESDDGNINPRRVNAYVAKTEQGFMKSLDLTRVIIFSSDKLGHIAISHDTKG